jgi:hypothetical protein
LFDLEVIVPLHHNDPADWKSGDEAIVAKAYENQKRLCSKVCSERGLIEGTDAESKGGLYCWCGLLVTFEPFNRSQRRRQDSDVVRTRPAAPAQSAAGGEGQKNTKCADLVILGDLTICYSAVSLPVCRLSFFDLATSGEAGCFSDSLSPSWRNLYHL